MATLLGLLIFFFGSIYCVYGIYHLLTRRFLNPYKLFMIFGKKGSGKSTYLVRLSRKYLKKGWNVYTNMDDLMLPGVRRFNLTHLGNFVPSANSVLLLDEIGMVWDARDFAKFPTSVRDFFKLQRHYRVLCYMASQSFDVDKKLRDLTDGMFLHVNRFRVFSIGRRIARTVTLTAPDRDQGSHIVDALRFTPFWQWTITYIPKYAKYFDSHIIPAKPQLTYQTVSGPEPSKHTRLNKIKIWLQGKKGVEK